VLLAQGLQTLQHAPLLNELRTACTVAEDINRHLESRVGTLAPNMSPLLALLAVGREAALRLEPNAIADTRGTRGEGHGARLLSAAEPEAKNYSAAGELRDRSDVERELERVCRWLEQHEPSNPVPLLLRRAQRLMRMNFVEIIQDIASNGLDQVRAVVGSESDPNA
jgi:type VI secretion system protein ImpA